MTYVFWSRYWQKPVRRTVTRYACAMTLLAFHTALPPEPAAQSLRGSAASLDRQNDQAARHDFTYLSGPSELERFVRAGYLVPVRRTRHYSLKDVSFPYTRPEVKLFIDRVAEQYHRGCGEQLVVTSLTRPRSHQPRNASPRSVHPTGMALDLRRSSNRGCREWLESTLLYLEDRGVLEATRERGPPHYHIAVFPHAYAQHVAALKSARSINTVPAPPTASVRHTVRRRDTLWDIARRYGTTPMQIRQLNRLRSSLIHPGQVLTIPVPSESAQ